MIKYIKGDATAPEGEGNKFVCHVCNDEGRWGRGFVMALSRRWKRPEMLYRTWHRGGKESDKVRFKLGEIQLVQVENEITVVNMIGQKGIRKWGNKPPIRYDAVKACLEKVAAYAKKHDASVHMPRIGCGLAGGKWEKIEEIIQSVLCKNNIEVTVYDL